MRELQQKVFDHLTVPDHPQRIQCLFDLIDRKTFDWLTDDEFVGDIEGYLNKNPRGFCAEGIQRLMDVILPQRRRTYNITLEITASTPKGAMVATALGVDVARFLRDNPHVGCAGVQKQHDWTITEVLCIEGKEVEK